MQNIQAVFDRMQEKKKKLKDLRGMYKDGLDNDKRYKDLVEELKAMRTKKQQIENDVQVDMGEAYDKLESLRDDINADQQLINDIAMATIMKGQDVKIVDENNNRYEPEFKVTLKKSGFMRKEDV